MTVTMKKVIAIVGLILLCGVLVYAIKGRLGATIAAISSPTPGIPDRLAKTPYFQEAWSDLLRENAAVKDFQRSAAARDYQHQLDITNGTFYRLQAVAQAAGYQIQADNSEGGFVIVAMPPTAAIAPPSAAAK